jgi:FkbM family methyltransferase
MRDEGAVATAASAARHFGNTAALLSRASKRDLLRGRLSVDVDGKWLEIPKDMAWTFRGGAYYERNVVTWFLRLLTETNNPVVYDVGANYGYFTLLAAQRSKAVHCFEPVSKTAAGLEGTIRRNGMSNVTLHRTALSDAEGRATMTLFSSSGNDSFVERHHDDVSHLRILGEEQVEVATIDGLVAAGMERPDLIKIDAEGAERQILVGASATLREHRPMLLLEYNHLLAMDAGYTLADLVAALHGTHEVLFLDHHHDTAHRLGELEVERVATVVATPPAVFDRLTQGCGKF